MRTFRIAASTSLGFCAACSLVNALDDVKEGVDAYDAAPAPEAAVEDGPIGDAGAHGLIVLGGEVERDGATTSVLTVLDPETGNEIAAREEMVVAGIRYDGARDLWYIFESPSSFVPAPDERVTLHVRTFDPIRRVWTEHSKRELPALQSYESIGVVRDRLAYVAYVEGDAGALELVTLDTSDPKNLVDMTRFPVDRAPLGIMATRASFGVGGIVSLVRVGTTCTQTCPVELVALRFPNSGPLSLDPPIELGQAPRFSVPAYGTFASAQRDVVVFPRQAAGNPSTATLFEAVLHDPVPGSSIEFNINDSALRRAAVAECERVAFVVGTNGDVSVHAVPLDGTGAGTPSSASTGHSGQQVYYEPTSRTVIAPFSQGPSFDLTAFRLSGTPSAPVLTRRVPPDWTPPPGLRPILLGVREPFPVVCP